MKRIIIGTACVMIIGTLVATLFYERSSEITLPEENNKLESDQRQLEPIQGIYEDDSIGYSLQNDQLQITFNTGKDWIKVPVEKSKLFEGEYNGNGQVLIENSYTLTQNRISFLYVDATSPEGNSIKLINSIDQGNTWEHTVVKEQYPPIRFRKVEFLNDSFGYVIISGDRTMSQEWTTVYLTRDGGKQWIETTHSNVTRLIYDGGFVDENTGFLSFGILSPEKPDLYLTPNGEFLEQVNNCDSRKVL
ncbi:WD40/YVTN/BNR-like repeat-containing protein [Mesobacillus foraminis]|uniref:WD40/YVTN/BNR-like repeat-containing protein n=1 Tax=Mesobacillus foraminis TaxID=279826 RepID=UPI00214BF90D|nr:oxidoreductase [Mesobacillus foraminis]